MMGGKIMTKETLTRKQKLAEFAEEGYNISVTGRHLHVTDAMKAYAHEKLSKIERMGDRIIDINVIMDIQKLDQKVDITMKYGHTLIKSHGSSTDMYVSIDQAVDKLQTQLRRYKRRLKNHHAKGYPVVEMPVTVYSPLRDVVDEEEINVIIEEQARGEVEKALQPHHIVKVDTQPLRILTDDEAVMKMELTGLPVIVFRDEVTRKFKVIYQRDDGNYGIIQPE
jgi:putative sigma-54 modulation protein